MNLTEFFSQIRWRPGIGDPSLFGWLTVVAYALAAALCFAAARRGLAADDSVPGRRRYRVWLGVTVLMLILCINKQLDLQSLFTDIGRALARQEGWYGQRRIVQRWFVLMVAAGGIAAFAMLAWKSRSLLRERMLLLVGLSALIAFIVIRAASFHHVDVLINSRLMGVRFNVILELGAIALIAISAARSAARPREG